MSQSKRIAGRVLRGVGKVLLMAGALAFLWGGRAISEFAKIDRLFAELYGLLAAAALALLGFFAETRGKAMDRADDS